MERLFIIRHGSSTGGRINDHGREQMALLAQRIQEGLNGGSVLLLSSTAPRALDSAEVLAGVLGVPIEEHEVLWSDVDHPDDYERALDLIRKAGECTQVLLVVTHMEYVEFFPGYFARKEWATPPRNFDVGKGRAVVLDCLQKTAQLF